MGAGVKIKPRGEGEGLLGGGRVRVVYAHLVRQGNPQQVGAEGLGMKSSGPGVRSGVWPWAGGRAEGGGGGSDVPDSAEPPWQNLPGRFCYKDVKRMTTGKPGGLLP